MAKIKIDRLDLKKRKADLDREQAQRQVRIRLDESGRRKKEAEEERTWERPEQSDIAEESEIVNLRQRRARGGKKSKQATAAKSFEEKIAEKSAQRIKIDRGGEAGRPEVFAPDGADSYQRSLLANGLKLITAPIAGTKTVTALIMFSTGSKYESLSVSGLSHFLEHMFFKGTKKRLGAQKLSSELDALGCEYNAFTAKEYTGYWIKVDSSKIGAALDILSDMLLHSQFSAKEISKERGVIIEEINMYHENPMMYIEDVFESCLYGDTPAGREIAGTKANIKSFKRQNFLNYFNSQYGANSAVLCLAGQVDEKIQRLAERYFGKMPRSAFKEKIGTPDAQKVPAVKLHYKEGNQAVISLGVRAYNAYDEDKIILKLLAVILGGSMSSRMFTEVREKRGLAYSVHTSAECYTDTGYLTTQAGIPVGKQDQAVKVILAEYRKMRSKPVSKEELKRAKDLVKGRTIISFEQSDNVANWYAQRAVLKEAIITPEEYFTKIDKVKAEDIRRVAKDIFKNEKLNLAIIGPFQREEEFESILKL
ncbi:MAG: pitrilysin family protein [Patescibacteria group bacterium]|nr:pitrilysin family protein [Patescibacteria group bacterium]